jgi:hypothetical protein
VNQRRSLKTLISTIKINLSLQHEDIVVGLGWCGSLWRGKLAIIWHLHPTAPTTTIAASVTPIAHLPLDFDSS